MHKEFLHLDADESIFFARQLEYLKAKSYDIKYGELRARQLIPVATDVDPGAEFITYYQFDFVGIATIISSYSDDLRRADVRGKQFTSPVRALGEAYGYSIQEIRAAAKANTDLKSKKQAACRRAIAAAENTIAFVGSSDYGLNGLVNNPNISSTTIPADGAGSLTTFASKSPAQILRDMNAAPNYIVTNTKAVERADTLLLPTSVFNYVTTTPWSTTGDGSSILSLYLKNQPYIKEVTWLNELETAGAGGTKRMIAYRRDSEVLELQIPVDYEEFDPQPRNLEYVINAHERIGGVTIYYPLAVCYVDGI